MSQVAEHTGRVIGGRYRLITPAGAGSSASVYRAVDSRLGRPVAVKMLHGGLAGDPVFSKRFRAEAKSAAALNHPHIVRVFDWGDDEAGPYLVMEFLGGGSLAAMIEAGTRLSPAQAAKVGTDAARALEYAHRRGLVHRDVKPANILFDEDGRAAIADFGLARALAEAAWTEPAGSLFGTARYTSPEQAQGMPADGSSDVYSLGISLYEAVAGDIPFHADSTMSLVMARVGAHVDPPEEAGVLGVVIEGAMAPDKSDRIDATRMIEELGIAARHLPAPEPLPLVGTAGGLAGSGDDATVLPASSRSRTPVSGDLTAVGATEWMTDPGTPSARRARSGRRRTMKRRTAVVSAVLALVCIVGGGIAAAVETQVFLPKKIVPHLEGDSVAAARSAARAHHLSVTVGARRYVRGVSPGIVATQTPRPGSRLAQGDAVEVVVSKGSPFVTVPAGLDGSSEASAAAGLGAAGLHVAETSAYSQSVPAGDVISYGPSRGVRWGDTVTLTVSEGPQPVTIPSDLVGESPASVVSQLGALGLTVSQQSEHSSTVPSGQVAGTSPAAGQTAHQGDTVTVYVSEGPVMVSVPDVEGDSINQAVAALQSAGLNPQAVYGPQGPNATVYTTYPSAGASEPQGTQVTIYTAPGH